MGLAGTKEKQRFSYDPRNTKWAKDTNRFGHQYLEKQGWKPGAGLGLVSHAMTTHVKVQIKEDTVGLGAKLSKKQKKDEFDSGECAGLDVFQRILGRLNGKEEEISKELDIQKRENIINGKWGMQFVKGDTLRSTWDTDSKTLISKKGQVVASKENKKKRSRDVEHDVEVGSDSDTGKKKSKKDKKDKKEKKVKKDKKDKKKDKKETKEKEKKEKQDKKEKKEKKEKRAKGEVTRESMLTPNESREDSPAINTRLSVRSKWIKQKRAATMDAKALNEIFMISN